VLNAEPYLLETVLDAVQTAMGLTDQQCSIESDDDFVPQWAGDLYVTVTPASLNLGPVHQTSGTTRDMEFGCRVAAFLRSRSVPRDLRRTLFLDQVKGINAHLDKIIKAVDWNPSITVSTNTALKVQEPNAKGFIGYLRLVSVDAKPRGFVSDVYGAANQGGTGVDVYAGITRGAVFGRLRRMETL
jgi:hypothetical protein